MASQLEERLWQAIVEAGDIPLPVREISPGKILVEPDPEIIAAHLRGEEVRWTPGLRKRLQAISKPGYKVGEWRSDFVWPDYKFVIEVEGVGSMKHPSRHQLTPGFKADVQKYRVWQRLLGYRVHRVCNDQVNDRMMWLTLDDIRWFLQEQGWVPEGAPVTDTVRDINAFLSK